MLQVEAASDGVVTTATNGNSQNSVVLGASDVATQGGLPTGRRLQTNNVGTTLGYVAFWWGKVNVHCDYPCAAWVSDTYDSSNGQAAWCSGSYNNGGSCTQDQGASTHGCVLSTPLIPLPPSLEHLCLLN